MCVCVCEWGGEGHTHTHTTKGGLTFGSCGLSVECLQLYLFPRELPNHTSYPSLKMQYAKLSRVHNLKADNSTPVLRNAHRRLFWLFIHLSSTHLSLSLSRPLSLSLDLSRPLSTSLDLCPCASRRHLLYTADEYTNATQRECVRSCAQFSSTCL